MLSFTSGYISTFHTQEEWYKAEYTLPTFFGSLTSHTYRLWSLYTQESHWLVGSNVKAIVSGYFASAIPEKRRLASVTLAMSVPKKCGFGSVVTK